MDLFVDGRKGASKSASSTYVRELGAVDLKTDTVPLLVESAIRDPPPTW